MIRDLLFADYKKEAVAPLIVYSERMLNADLYDWFLKHAPEWRAAPLAEYNWRKESLVTFTHVNPVDMNFVDKDGNEHCSIRIDYELLEEESDGITTKDELVERVAKEIMKILKRGLKAGIEGLTLREEL